MGWCVVYNTFKPHGELEDSKEYVVFEEKNANEEDRYAKGWFPVCFNEFVDNEYKAYKDDAGVL